jgi:hypothetical protein
MGGARGNLCAALCVGAKVRDWTDYDDRMLRAAQTLRAVYDRRSVLLNAVGDVGVREQMCEIQIRAADFVPAPIVGDRIAIGGQTFRITQPPQADGEGGAVITISQGAA